jgi:hypothetical protein
MNLRFRVPIHDPRNHRKNIIAVSPKALRDRPCQQGAVETSSQLSPITYTAPDAPLRTVRLLPRKPERHGSQRESWYLYDVLLDGECIVTGSRDPECDLARALLTRGIEGVVEVIDGITGKPRSQVNIETAANLTVEEGRRIGPRFIKWKPFPTEGSP